MKRAIIALISLFFISRAFAGDAGDALPKAQALFAQGLYPQAAQAYQEILSSDRENAKAALGMGLALNQLGENDTALQACQKSRELDPKDAESYLCLGLVYADEGNFDEALKNFLKASRTDPYFPESHFNAGICYWHKKQFPQAVAAFQKFFKVHPGLQTAHFILGSFESPDINPIKEIKSCREAIAQNPSDAKSYGSLGIILMQTGQLKNAVAAFKSAAAIAPGYARAYFNLGVIFQKTNDDPAARQYFAKAAEADPRYRLLLASGIFEKQKATYDKEIECRKKAMSAAYYVNFSDVYYALGSAFCLQRDRAAVNAQIVELEKLSRHDLSENLKSCLAEPD